jgi:hypothetical protein
MLILIAAVLIAFPATAGMTRGGQHNVNKGNKGVSKSGPGAQHHIYNETTIIKGGGGGGHKGGGGGKHGGGHPGGGTSKSDAASSSTSSSDSSSAASAAASSNSRGGSSGGASVRVEGDEYEATVVAPSIGLWDECQTGVSAGGSGWSGGVGGMSRLCALGMLEERYRRNGNYVMANEIMEEMREEVMRSPVQRYFSDPIRQWVVGPIFSLLPWIGDSAYR